MGARTQVHFLRMLWQRRVFKDLFKLCLSTRTGGFIEDWETEVCGLFVQSRKGADKPCRLIARSNKIKVKKKRKKVYKRNFLREKHAFCWINESKTGNGGKMFFFRPHFFS